MNERFHTLVAAILLLAGGLTACGGEQSAPHEGDASTATACAEHDVSNCPFCHPDLLESMGFCKGHGVPEAICTRCRGDLEEAYRAKGDWCGGHGLPESQCEKCNPGVLDQWKSYADDAAPADTGQSATSTATDPCDEHAVANCPFCDPSLLESMGFCEGHGVPEAVCTKCRDDLEAAYRAEGDWCDGHGLPESHCEACNPGTLDRYQSSRRVTPPEEATDDIAVLPAEMPRFRRSPSVVCSTDSSVVRLADASVADRVGIRTEKVSRSALRRTLEAPATVEYDARAHARLAPRAQGTIVGIPHDLGATVHTGTPLVEVDCAELGMAKAKLLQALAHVELWKRNAERERALLEDSLSTEREAMEAETQLAESEIELAAAEQRLANLGLSEDRIAAVKESGDTSSLLTLRAPFAGTVVGLDAVIGEVVGPNAPIVSVADTSRMWVMLDVDQSDVRFVAVGQPVLLELEGWRGESVGGHLTWISSDVDPRSRTVKARAEFVNTDGRLRASGFGTARIVTRDDEEAVFVPKMAVQWEGCCNVSFVRRSATEFVPRKLRLGYDAGDHYEVLQGLDGGETVVTQGSFVLKTELRKGSIGAGCCEVDHLDE